MATLTIEITKADCRRICTILAADKRDYQEGIERLEELKEQDPTQKVGKLNQTPEEAIKTTRQAISAIECLMAQIKGC